VLANLKPSFATTLYLLLITSPKVIRKNFLKPTSLSSLNRVVKDNIERDVTRPVQYKKENKVRRDLSKAGVYSRKRI
jgi:hypothetical protein